MRLKSTYEDAMISHSLLGVPEISVYPVFDVHLGNPFCMEEQFREFIRETAATPNRYLILGGDLVENNLRGSVGHGVYDQIYAPHIQKRMMAEILEPVKDRILCVLQGNHERRSREVDSCPAYDICTKLDIEPLYRDSMAYVAIDMGKKKTEKGQWTNSDKRPIYVFAVTHGSGGGALTGGSANRTERFLAFNDCDVLITGHTHKPYITMVSSLRYNLQTRKVYRTQAYNISATSWLEYGGYATQKMLSPSAHCLQRIVLSGESKAIDVNFE